MTPEQNAARREGVSSDQVKLAIERLTREGGTVTLRSVRAEIGSGSLTTIQKHLSSLRQAPSDCAPDLALSPQVLRALATEVGRVVGERTNQLEQEARQARAALEQVLEEYETLQQANSAAAVVNAKQRETLHEQLGREGASKVQLQEVGELLLIARSEAETARQTLALSQQQLESNRERCTNLNADVQTMRQELLDARAELERTRRGAEEARRAITALEGQLAASHAEKVALEQSLAKIEELRTELQDVHSRAAVLEVARLSLEERLIEAKQLLARTEANAQQLLDKVLSSSATEHRKQGVQNHRPV